MEFLATKDFKPDSRKLWKRLEEDKRIVITRKGKPAALLLDLKNADLERTLNDLRKIEGMRLRINNSKVNFELQKVQYVQ